MIKLISNDMHQSCSNKVGSTAMHSAVFGNHLEIVKLLIEKGAHFDAIDDVSGTMITTVSDMIISNN